MPLLAAPGTDPGTTPESPLFDLRGYYLGPAAVLSVADALLLCAALAEGATDGERA